MGHSITLTGAFQFPFQLATIPLAIKQLRGRRLAHSLASDPLL